MKLNEVVALAVHLVYGSDIHVPDFSCWTCLNGQKAFWVTCPSAHSFFVIWSFPSPYRELYFVLPLLCDLLHIHMICTVSAFQPNVLSMPYCVYTSNGPRLCRVNSTTVSAHFSSREVNILLVSLSLHHSVSCFCSVKPDQTRYRHVPLGARQNCTSFWTYFPVIDIQRLPLLYLAEIKCQITK